jgi:membrane associated rhomboid family serine protease
MIQMGNSEKFKITYILIALNIAFYVYTSIAGGDFVSTSDSMLLQYGQITPLILEGQYYRLITSMFVHASIAHLAGNMLFLLVFGLRAEEMFSLPEYLAVYFLGGLTGNLASLFLLPFSVSVGASGAIFAMFGAVAVYARRSINQSIIGALIYGFFLLFISSGEGVNVFAHLGGLVCGLIIGYALATRRKPDNRYSFQYSYSAFP